MRLRLAYLCTTFPTASETFLQREVRALRGQPVDFTIYSLWGGEAEWEGLPVERFRKARLWSVPFWLVYWMWRRPRAMLAASEALTRQPAPTLLNALENLLGLGFALVSARDLERAGQRPHFCHAVWASGPAAAAWLIERLIGVPYSMGAHAFDVFQHGGDWLLVEKLRRARLVHTTTAAAQARLIERGAEPGRIALIRRGLDEIPPLGPRREPGEILRLLAIGRLVRKKGFNYLLLILRHLRAQGVKFECRLVGGGPMALELQARAVEYGLSDQFHLLGPQPYDAVAALQREWADCFLFTGLIAPDGDRDGLPNVIPEAMAAGVPVVTAPGSGAMEAVRTGDTGWVVPLADLAGWRDAIVSATRFTNLAAGVRQRAYAWVTENYSARRNAERLIEAVRQAIVGAKLDLE
jgi:colanic acid/amylovoran biosynthesis glycosyltransferase